MTEISNEAFQDFVLESRIRMNQYLNKILKMLVLTGPAIAFGVWVGIFPYATYQTCLNVSALLIVLYFVHGFLVRRIPKSRIAGMFALTMLDVLIVYMANSNVAIRITWFFVPLMSVLFCDKVLYLYALVVNYIMMALSTWVSVSNHNLIPADFSSSFAYFLDIIGGLLIEMFVMEALGFVIIKLAMDHFRDLYHQNVTISEKEKSEQEKMEILDSMAEIYQNVNLIRFADSTEMSLRDSAQEKHGIDMKTQSQTQMNQKIMKNVIPEQLEDFQTFTNITTLRDRLANKKIISREFMDVNDGWFRAQYITVDAAPDGRPEVVIYTTRNIDEEKRREQKLLRISMTDEMTRLGNRRCYDKDKEKLRSEPPEEKLVVFAIDVNGLKPVNDTKGHMAGDELIKAAANCLKVSVRREGNVYRIGGDEFMALVRTDHPEELRERIHKNASRWCGMYSDEMSMSVGYAAAADHKGLSVDELEHIADENMYSEKENYYQENRIERRRR